MTLFLLVPCLFCQTPAPPYRTLDAAAAKPVLLVQAARTTGFQYATGIVVDAKRRLALVPWHAVKDAERLRAVPVKLAEGAPDSNPNSYASALAGKEGIPFTVVYAEPWNDLALARLDSLPADTGEARFVPLSAKPESKLRLQGHPYERNLVFQNVEGRLLKTEFVRWEWDGGQRIATAMIEIEAPEGPGHGFSGGVVRDAEGKAVGMVCAGRDSKLYAVEGGVASRFLERADRAQRILDGIRNARGASKEGTKP